MSVPLCAFGSAWDEHEPFARPLLACPGCRDESARLCAEFDAAVARGEFDRQGYSPAERAEKARKVAA